MSEPKQALKQLAEHFTRHPHSVGETYPQHLRCASWYGLQLVLAGFACIIHSVFPFLFVNTASNTVQRIYQHIQERNNTPGDKL